MGTAQGCHELGSRAFPIGPGYGPVGFCGVCSMGPVLYMIYIYINICVYIYMYILDVNTRVPSCGFIVGPWYGLWIGFYSKPGFCSQKHLGIALNGWL